MSRITFFFMYQNKLFGISNFVLYNEFFLKILINLYKLKNKHNVIAKNKEETTMATNLDNHLRLANFDYCIGQ